MSNYVKATNFNAKDALATGNPNKIIKGTEIDNEFNAIATSVATKADLNSPTFTGVPLAPTAISSTNTTQIATTAFVKSNLGTIASQNANAVAIAGGTITGITDLAVADGGTGVSTIAANAVVLGNGTSAIQTVAPSTSGNVLTSNGTTWTSTTPVSGIGSGQTWQNLSSSRAYTTTYTNSTGKPIMVCVQGSIASTGGFLNISLTVDGLVVSQNGGNNVVPSSLFTAQAIVPNGSTYSGNASSNGTITKTWFELR